MTTTTRASRRKLVARARTTNDRGILTRETVIDAAAHLIREHGHESFAMRALARRLNVTATALYLYFDDKLDVLNAVAEIEYRRRAQSYRDLEDLDPLARIRAIARHYVQAAIQEPELFRLTLQFPPIASEPGRDDPRMTGHEAFQVAERAVEQAIAMGHIAPRPAREASLIIWSAIHGVAAFALEGASFAIGRELDLGDSVIETVLRGLNSKLTPMRRTPGRIG